MNETNKKQLEIMNSKKPYKLWIGGRNTGYRNFVKHLNEKLEKEIHGEKQETEE